MLLLREFHDDCDLVPLLRGFKRDSLRSDCGHYGKAICSIAVIFGTFGSILLLKKIFLSSSQCRWAD